MNRYAICVLLAACVPLPFGSGCTSRTSFPRRLTVASAEWRAHVTTAEGLSERMKGRLRPDADPCRDFFEYACGGSTPAVAYEGAVLPWVRTQSRDTLWQTLEGLREPAVLSEDDRALRDFFTRCIDSETRRIEGARPAHAFLDRAVTPVTDSGSFMRALGALHRHRIPAFFDTNVVPALDDPSRYGLELAQGGLGLWQPQAYLSDSPMMLELRRRYRQFIRSELVYQQRDGDPDGSADAIIALETALARHFAHPTALYAETGYERLTVSQLDRLTGLPWQPYFEALGVDASVAVNLAPASYFRALGPTLGQFTPAALRAYVEWRLLEGTRDLWTSWAGIFPQEVPAIACVDATEAAFGQQLWRRAPSGGLDPSAGVTRDTVSKAIRAELIERLRHAESLGPDRDRFIARVGAVEVMQSAPASVASRGPLPAGRGFFEVAMAARAARWDAERELLGRAVDGPTRREIAIAPIPAYFVRLNTVALPPGVVQPPLFSPGFPAVVNFAGLGFIVAHELAHSIDRHARGFAPDGRLNPAQPGSGGDLAARDDCLKRRLGAVSAAPEFYSRLTASVLPAIPLDPDLTFDESFADVIGLQAAFDAFHRQPADPRWPQALVAGLAPEQVFFVAFAQNWCFEGDKHTRHLLAEFDVHAPSRARVNAAVSGLPAFAEAFQCAPGTPLRPTATCEVL